MQITNKWLQWWIDVFINDSNGECRYLRNTFNIHCKSALGIVLSLLCCTEWFWRLSEERCWCCFMAASNCLAARLSQVTLLGSTPSRKPMCPPHWSLMCTVIGLLLKAWTRLPVDQISKHFKLVNESRNHFYHTHKLQIVYHHCLTFPGPNYSKTLSQKN